MADFERSTGGGLMRVGEGIAAIREQRELHSQKV